jgi:hypothetical protein
LQLLTRLHNLIYMNQTFYSLSRIFTSLLLLSLRIAVVGHAFPVDKNYSSIGKDFKKLVNYPYLSKEDSISFASQRIEQLKARKRLNIPEQFTIPIEMVAYRKNGKNGYVEKYNTERSVGVGYIPSDLMAYYEQESWKAYQTYGKDAPTLSIVLAQQFTESHFDPTIRGDQDQSIGLPQLFFYTAKWLYSKDPDLWKGYFYFDQQGRHHFHDVRSMVSFPFLFLHKYKKYRAEQKLEGLKRYNGAGKRAVRYAKLVMQRSLFYENWMAQYYEVKVDESKLYDLLSAYLEMQLFDKKENQLSEEIKKELFELARLDFKTENQQLGQNMQITLDRYQENEVLVEKNRDFEVVNDNREHYIRIEEGRTLYSYFKKVSTLIEVINHPKNSAYYCYHKKNGVNMRIKKYEDIKNGSFYTNAKVGDWIYIPAGTVLFSPETNVLIMAGNF